MFYDIILGNNIFVVDIIWKEKTYDRIYKRNKKV